MKKFDKPYTCSICGKTIGFSAGKDGHAECSKIKKKMYEGSQKSRKAPLSAAFVNYLTKV